MLILPVYLTIHKCEVTFYALIDSRVEGKAFIDKDWAILQVMQLLFLKQPFNLEIFDGWFAESGKDTYYIITICYIKFDSVSYLA